MNLVYIGKLVNTHGLKGEVRIISDFRYKDTIFKTGNNLYINDSKYTIKSYRIHKNFDMVVFDEINDIDRALELKGYNVYINRSDYKFDGYLDEDLIGLSVYDKDVCKGRVVDILKTKSNDILVIDGVKRHLVPNIPVFVKNVDLDNNRIEINYIKGLDYED